MELFHLKVAAIPAGSLGLIAAQADAPVIAQSLSKGADVEQGLQFVNKKALGATE